MLNPKDIAYLVVHCSDTPDDAALTGRDIHQMHLGLISEFDRAGNDCADEAAKKGARTFQVPWRTAKYIDWVDSTMWQVYFRIICICNHYLGPKQKKEEPYIKIVRHPQIEKLTSLGHDVVNRGPRESCLRCGCSWIARNRHIMLDRGICSGGDGFIPSLQIPFRVKQETVFNGEEIHPSHNLGWIGGILFCLTCGCYTQLRVADLALKCKMKPHDGAATWRLKRILEGKHPSPTSGSLNLMMAPPISLRHQVATIESLAPLGSGQIFELETQE